MKIQPDKENNILEVIRLTLNTKISNILILPSVVLCNKNTHIEVYNKELVYKYNILLNEYTKEIIKFSDDLLIFVMSDHYIINSVKEEESKIKFLELAKHNVILPCFSFYHIYNNLVVLYNNKSLRIFYLTSNKLVEDDTPNDLEYYKIQHINIQGNTINIIVKDIEDTIFLLKYSLNNNKLVLNKKSKKMCSSVFVYNQGFIFIGDGIIWYEIDNKKIIESEFGNNQVKTSIIYKDKLILSMEYNELITIRSNMSSLSFDIKVFKINTFNNLYNINDNILGHCKSGKCYLFSLSNKIDIINSIDSVLGYKKCMELDNSLVFYDGYSKSTLSNLLNSDITHFCDIEGIEIFYIFKDLLILVYKDRSDFVDINNISNILYKFDQRIINIYEYNDTLFMNTSTGIYFLNNISEGINIEINNIDILICSFYKNNYVYYTLDSLLHTRTNNLYIEDLSCILCSDVIYLSTYTNQYIILDYSLKEIYRTEMSTFITGVVHNNINYFYDINNILWEVNIDKIIRLGLYKNIKKLISADKLYLLGKYSIIYEDNKIIDIFDIKHLLSYNDKIFIYKDNNISNIIINNVSDYKYKQENNSFLFMNKINKKIITVDNKGNLFFDNSIHKLTRSNNLEIKGIYLPSTKYYSILINNKIYNFNIKTKSLTQESINKDIIDIYDRNIKITYNEIIINNNIIPYKNGIIKYTNIKNNEILLIDLFKGFYIYDILYNEWFYYSYGNYSLGYLYKSKYIILSDNTNILIYDRDTNYIYKYFINDRLVCISEKSLELNKECLYCVTEGNSIYKIIIKEDTTMKLNKNIKL